MHLKTEVNWGWVLIYDNVLDLSGCLATSVDSRKLPVVIYDHCKKTLLFLHEFLFRLFKQDIKT